MTNIIIYGPSIASYTFAYLVLLQFRKFHIKINIIEDISSNIPTPWCGADFGELYLNGSIEEFLDKLMNSADSSIYGLEETSIVPQQRHWYHYLDKPMNRTLMVKHAASIKTTRSAIYHPVKYTNYLRNLLLCTNLVSFSAINNNSPNAINCLIDQFSLQRKNEQITYFNFNSNTLESRFNVLNCTFDSFFVNSNLFDLSWYSNITAFSARLPHKILWIPSLQTDALLGNVHDPSLKYTKKHVKLADGRLALAYSVHLKNKKASSDLNLVHVLNLSSFAISAFAESVRNGEVPLLFSRL